MIGVLEETAYKERLEALKTFTLEIARNHKYLKDCYAEDRCKCSKLLQKTGQKPVVRNIRNRIQEDIFKNRIGKNCQQWNCLLERGVGFYFTEEVGWPFFTDVVVMDSGMHLAGDGIR